MPKPWENKSGGKDLTAFKATRNSEEQKRVSQFVEAVRDLAELSGFEITNWLKIRVKKTGNEY